MPRHSCITVAGSLLILLLPLSGCQHSPTPPDTGAILREARARVDSCLSDGRFQEAYDVLLVMMRVAPDVPAVFDTTVSFIKAACAAGDNQALNLADDMLSRALALLPYQPLDRVVQARALVSSLESMLASAGAPASSPSPVAREDLLDRARQLLLLAQRTDLPIPARVELCARVRSELTQAALLRADTEAPLADEWMRQWEALLAQTDAAERAVLADDYETGLSTEVATWLGKSHPALRDASSAQDADPLINPLLAEGERLLRRCIPYSEAGLEPAKADRRAIEKRLARLRQHREWEYNRWTLKHVRDVEAADIKPYRKLMRLAKINQQRLYPYVAQRWQQNWDKNFEELSEDKKTEALKLLITGYVNQ